MKIYQISSDDHISSNVLSSLRAKLEPLEDGNSLTADAHDLFIANHISDELEIPQKSSIYVLATQPHKVLEKAQDLEEPNGIHIITIIGESRLLYGRKISTILQNFLEKSAYLAPNQLPMFHMLVQEGLVNAVEYGTLGLAGEKDKLINETDWFEVYKQKIEEKLSLPEFSEKLITIQCYITEDELITSITDQGEGFDFEKRLKEAKEGEDNHTLQEQPYGMGIGLLEKVANSIRYEDGGCTFKFGIKTNFIRDKVLQGSETITIKGLRSTARVLIVDDQPSNRQFAKFYLVSAGYELIEEACDGQEAIEKVNTFQPDIILLDIIMPDIDGFSVCRHLKQNPATADIPILFLSGLTDAKSRVKGYRLGAVDYVNKPIDRNELIARTDIHIQNAVMFNSLQRYSQRIEKDLEKARLSQEGLLPKAEDIKKICKKHKVRINHVFNACDELAGDYWSLFDVSDDTISIAMADFTGHGVAASLNTVFLHSMFYELSVFMIDPVQFVSMINTRLHALLSIGNFATFVFALIDTQTGEVTYISSGYPSILVVPQDKDEELQLLDGSGIPLGLASSKDITFEKREFKIQPGDTLFFYSDALTETEHGKNGMWMDEGLINAVKDLRSSTTKTLQAQDVLKRFNKTATLPVKDDLTLVSITYAADKVANFPKKR